jgi:SNF family Na+-dependent transporter
MEKRDEQTIMRDFTVRQTRQIVAIAAALFLVLLLAALYKRPDLFGNFSQYSLSVLQAMLIIVFVNFTAFNWRCPSCRKYLGSNINRRVCRRCGARLR